MFNLILWSFFIVLFCIWWYANSRIPKKFPPGPRRYPIVGSLPFMLHRGRSTEEKSFMHGILYNVKQYGKLIGFFVGSKPFIVIADYNLMKDLLRREELSGRPPAAPLNEFRPGHNTIGLENKGRFTGILWSQGSDWREQRRFLLRNLRDFGFGKSEMEDCLLYTSDAADE